MYGPIHWKVGTTVMRQRLSSQAWGGPKIGSDRSCCGNDSQSHKQEEVYGPIHWKVGTTALYDLCLHLSVLPVLVALGLVFTLAGGQVTDTQLKLRFYGYPWDRECPSCRLHNLFVAVLPRTRRRGLLPKILHVGYVEL